MKKIGVLSVQLDTLSCEEAARQVIACAKAGKPCLTVTPNAAILYRAQRDTALFSALSSASLVMPDGAGVVWGAKALGTPLEQGRVAGVDLGRRVLALAAEEKLPVAFFGGKEGVAALAEKRLTEELPGLSVVYTRSGFAFTLDEVSEALRRSSAKIVFCCLGSPRQETVGQSLSKRLSLPVLTLGGSLDVYARCKPRAPLWMQRASLEWLFRCLCEPRRFLKLHETLGFVFSVLRAKNGRKHGKNRKRSCNLSENRYNTK